jgi:hypothetical protein
VVKKVHLTAKERKVRHEGKSGKPHVKEMLIGSVNEHILFFFTLFVPLIEKKSKQQAYGFNMGKLPSLE